MKDNRITKSLKTPWVALALIALVVVAVYSNIYAVPFVFDGTYHIKENLSLRSFDIFLSPKILFHPRPLGFLTYALNYRFGKLDVFGYHLVNVVIHIVNGFLTYFLALGIYGRLCDDSISGGSRCAQSLRASVPWMALLCALIFVAHPIQTQAVTYTAQRYTSLAAMFYFLSILCYMRGRVAAEGSGKQAGSGGLVKLWAYFVASFFCGVLAFLSKPHTGSLPGAILLVEYCLFDRTWQGWKRKLLWFGPIFVLMGIFILYVSGLFRGGVQFGSLLEDVSGILRAPQTDVGRWVYFCTQLNVIVIYIRLLFLPIGQNLDYMYPFKAGFFDGYTPAAFLFLVALVGIGIWQIKKRPVISFGIFWFFITLSIESSFFPIRDALFEHRLYLPMFGFAIVVVYGMFCLLSARQTWAAVLLTLVIVSFGSAAYFRNKAYRDRITLWSDVVIKSPNNFRAYYNLGNALYYAGRPDEAIRNYAEAIRIREDFAEAHDNLGVALLHQGRMDDALRHIVRANRIKPKDPEIQNNLGEVLIRQGRLQEAVLHLREAIRLKPDLAEAHNNLGIALAQMGKLEEGIGCFTQALRRDPRNVRITINLGQALLLKGRHQEAVAVFSEAMRIEPASEAARQGLQRAMQLRDDEQQK